MLICPISGFRLRQARAKGGTFWYCPHSRGRMVTLEMAKHYLGEDAAREIWVRSEFKFHDSGTLCPSCTRPMRQVTEPGWMGGGQIDVCRSCHVFWIEPDKHKEIPHPEDLLMPTGDSTVLQDRADAAKEFLATKAKAEAEEEAVSGSGPEGIFATLPGFLGLPVEMSKNRALGFPVITAILTVGMILIHVLLTRQSPEFVRDWGFIPAEPFRNWGLNALTGELLHGGWYHLISNLYFLWMFGDDVEDDLGVAKYLGFSIWCALGANLMTVLTSGRPDVPHIGYSGVIMGLMAYYVLQFPKSRLAYLFPGVHLLPVPGGGTSFLTAWRWIRLPVWVVAIFYFGKDLFYYLFLERDKLTGTSHSAHIGGILAGVMFWLLFSRKRSVEKIQRNEELGQRLLLPKRE